MLEFFNVCLWLGLVLAVLNILLGVLGVFNSFDFDFHIHFDLGSMHIGSFLPLSPNLMIIFITVFGGTGKILYDNVPNVLAVILALLPGFAITYAINRFLAQPLRHLSEKECADEADIIGLNAVVSDKIFENGFGKITFRYDDSTISGPAKSADGKALPSGTAVVIIEIKGKVYIVERL